MSTRSGPCVPFLLLSAAASRLLVSFRCVGVPVFVFCPAPPLCCPPLLVPAALALRCVLSFLVPPCLLVVCLVFLPALSVLRSVAFVLNSFVTFWVLLNYCGPWRFLFLPLVSGPLFGFCASVFRVVVAWLCVGGPFVLVVVGVFVRGRRTRPEPWTGLHCSEFHWR